MSGKHVQIREDYNQDHHHQDVVSSKAGAASSSSRTTMKVITYKEEEQAKDDNNSSHQLLEAKYDDNSPNVECFQNFTAPEVFIQGLAGMINQQDISTIIKSQKYMMQRFEKTNEMLINCNELGTIRFQNALQDFKNHVTMLKDFKKDMDNIFKRIRVIKAKLASQYPQQFELAASIQRKEKRLNRDDEDDDED